MNAERLPDWLVPQNPVPVTVRKSKHTMHLQESLFESVFEGFMERVASGVPLQTIIDADPRGIDLGLFMRWIMKSKKRKAEYHECLKVCAEIMLLDIVQIADAQGTLEEVNRSSLRIESRKYFMKISDKHRFADTKTLDVNTNPLTEDDLKDIPTEELMQMMIDGEFDDPIDTELEEVRSGNNQ